MRSRDAENSGTNLERQQLQPAQHLLAGTTIRRRVGTGCCRAGATAQAQPKQQPNSSRRPAGKPNILMIMADDIGWFNVSAYNHGIMGYRTPNIDRIAKEGALFTDWYGEQSCTAGRAAFITGQSPIRTGLTKVGLPGADIGLQAEDLSVAEVLKPLGYATGQFGKNHLGDHNEFLPTVHGFDEFFGNLYHLNAEEEPQNPDYPKDPRFRAKFGPRGVLKCKASDRGRSDRRSVLRPGRQAGDREHRPARHQAHGDGGRGVPRCRARFHRPASSKRRHAVVLLLQSHPHARLDASEAGVAGQDRPRGLSRRHGGTRRLCRPAAQEARRPRRRQQHHRRLHHRQRRRSHDLAGRRHHAVPRREGDQLGRRLPRADGHALARHDPARHRLQRDVLALRPDPDIRGGRRRSGHRRQSAAEVRRSATRPSRFISTATISSRSSRAR